MSDEVVDVVIPLHRADRPVGDAIRSADTAAQGIATRVTVVLHDLVLPDDTERELAQRAQLVRCDDGIPSPSGPRNAGFAATTSPFVFFLDSDDHLAPDCLRQLHQAARDTDADVVLPSIRSGSGYVGVPFVASRSPRLLDPARDGLFFRGHSVALLRRSALERTGVRYPAGIRTGEDFAFLAQLSATLRVALAFDAVYVKGEHGGERITTVGLTAHERLAPARHVLTSEWVGTLQPEQRQALVERILITNLAGEWRNRAKISGPPMPTVFAEVRDLATTASPDAIGMLSVRDRLTLRFEERPGRWRRVGMSKPFGVLPSSLRGAVSRRGPLAAEIRRRIVAGRRRRSAA